MRAFGHEFSVSLLVTILVAILVAPATAVLWVFGVWQELLQGDPLAVLLVLPVISAFLLLAYLGLRRAVVNVAEERLRRGQQDPDAEVEHSSNVARAPDQSGPGEFRTLHYVSQVGVASDFFNRFLGALSVAISHRADLRLRFHATAVDPYVDTANLLARIPETDAVMVIPKDLIGLDLDRLQRALAEHPTRRVIFIDRAPPRDLLNTYGNTSFVGVNNRRVGILAAMLLWKELTQLSDRRLYAVVSGPGGPERSAWFTRTINILDSGAPTRTILVPDRDRLETEHPMRTQRQRILAQYPDHVMGLFAGNDETATSICHEALSGGFENCRIVGCDGTREMRQWVLNPHSIAVGTVFNDLYAPPTIETIILAMSGHVNVALEPRPFLPSGEDMVVHDANTAKLWAEAAW